MPKLVVHMLVPSNPIPFGLVAPAGSVKLTPAPLPELIRVTLFVPALAVHKIGRAHV